MTKDETVELDCELLNETPKAFQIEVMLSTKKKKTLWVGKSVAEVVGNKKGTKVTMPQWLAEKEGLV